MEEHQCNHCAAPEGGEGVNAQSTALSPALLQPPLWQQAPSWGWKNEMVDTGGWKPECELQGSHREPGSPLDKTWALLKTWYVKYFGSKILTVTFWQWTALLGEKSQKRMATLVQDDRKETVILKNTLITANVCRRPSLNPQHVETLTHKTSLGASPVG